jgi:hypothetical protein
VDVLLVSSCTIYATEMLPIEIAKQLGRVLGAALVLATAIVSYFTAEASWGSGRAAAGAALSLLLIPFAFSRVRLPDEESWRPSAAARRWARFMFGCSVLALVLLASSARVAPCDALRAMPARHPGLGGLSQALASLGALLAAPGGGAPTVPQVAPAPRLAPSASAK